MNMHGLDLDAIHVIYLAVLILEIISPFILSTDLPEIKPLQRVQSIEPTSNEKTRTLLKGFSKCEKWGGTRRCKTVHFYKGKN